MRSKVSYLTEFTSPMFVSGLSLNPTDMREVPPLLLLLAGLAVQVFHNVTVILGCVPLPVEPPQHLERRSSKAP